MFFNDIITYDEWIALELNIWKGIHLDIIKRILEAIPWRSGIENVVDLIRKYKDKAMFIAVSGGLDYLCERTVEELGFNTYLCVKPQSISNRVTGFADEYPDYRGKGEALLDFLNTIGIERERAQLICIGDNINDINLFKICDIAIAFCSNKSLEKYADVIVKPCNIRILVKVLDRILSSVSDNDIKRY